MADVQTGDLIEVKSGQYASTWWWVRFVRRWSGLDAIMPIHLLSDVADIRRGTETVNVDLQTQQSADVSTADVQVLIAPKVGSEAEKGWGQEGNALARGYFDDRIAHLELTEESWVLAL